jgi:hypothetical protein
MKFTAKYDEQYIRDRDALKPEAEKIANNRAFQSDDPWDYLFMQAMDELCEQRGICMPFAKGIKDDV